MDRKLQSRLAKALERLEEMFPPPMPEKLEHFYYRWSRTFAGHGYLQPDPSWRTPDIGQLLGLDEAIAQLRGNTEAFLAGKPCNHVVLTGPRGCGKTTIMHGVAGSFQKSKLRLIKIERNVLGDLPQLALELSSFKQRFLVLCDELSYGLSADGYLEVKSALDDLDRAGNVLMYASSNRRHLVAEDSTENEGAFLDAEGELHPDESTEEKISFVDRFGLQIQVFAPDQEEYLGLVAKWLQNYDVGRLTSQIRRRALNWARDRGSMNGRIAQQFVKSWLIENDA